MQVCDGDAPWSQSCVTWWPWIYPTFLSYTRPRIYYVYTFIFSPDVLKDAWLLPSYQGNVKKLWLMFGDCGMGLPWGGLIPAQRWGSGNICQIWQTSIGNKNPKAVEITSCGAALPGFFALCHQACMKDSVSLILFGLPVVFNYLELVLPTVPGNAANSFVLSLSVFLLLNFSCSFFFVSRLFILWLRELSTVQRS